MKNILIILQLLFVVTINVAQNKMNLFLNQMAIDKEKSDVKLNFLVKGEVVKIAEYIEGHEGVFQYSVGSISSVLLPAKYLPDLQSKDYVEKMEAFPKQMVALNDTMRVKNHVSEIHSGLLPLTQAYDGDGVVLGFIDTGIDFAHPDFKDSLGKSRIKYLWDMSKPIAPNTPQPYNYGQEWNNLQIDSGLASAHNDLALFGHGTHVAGIGAGNGLATGTNKGVAPKSDIVMVAYDFNYGGPDPRIAHAVKYIFDKAQALGKPCVINASLGNYFGSHDATDLEAQMIDSTLTQSNGRIMVCAVGNLGSNRIHLQHLPQVNDTNFSWFKYNAGYQGAYIQLFGSVADLANLKFSIGVDKVSPYYENRGKTLFFTAASRMSGVVVDSIVANGNTLGVIQSVASNYNGVVSLEVFITTDSFPDYKWRIISTGTGKFDSWSFDFESNTIPTPVVFPDIVNYVMPDTNINMIGSFACSDKVVTVANYYNTDRHIDYNNVLQISGTETPNALAENSSRGPTRDGRIKPDIAATGHHIMSCIVTSTMATAIANEPHKLSPGGYHKGGGGSSAASPVVAGIAALYLQKNPTANYLDFKNAITTCIRTDSFTWGPFPNAAWGYGKADGFAALTCSTVNVNTVLPVRSVHIYPNPSVGEITLDLPLEREAIKLTIFNSMGQKVYARNIHERKINLKAEGLGSGIYFILIETKKSSEIFKAKIALE